MRWLDIFLSVLVSIVVGSLTLGAIFLFSFFLAVTLPQLLLHDWRVIIIVLIVVLLVAIYLLRDLIITRKLVI